MPPFFDSAWFLWENCCKKVVEMFEKFLDIFLDVLMYTLNILFLDGALIFFFVLLVLPRVGI